MLTSGFTSQSFSRGRFSRLLSQSCDRPNYDRIIADFGDCVIAPTLGSIIPNWLLIVPRQKCVNFEFWQRQTAISVLEIISDFQEKFDISSDRIIWFEHGAIDRESKIGCGVDHAHIHLLVDPPFSFEKFTFNVNEAAKLAWQTIGASSAYKKLPQNRTYLIMGSKDVASLCSDVESIGSQFFRRIIACLAGSPQDWDYKAKPHHRHVAITLKNFGRYLRHGEQSHEVR